MFPRNHKLYCSIIVESTNANLKARLTVDHLFYLNHERSKDVAKIETLASKILENIGEL